MVDELYRALVYRQQKNLLQQIEKEVLDGKASYCFLALAYAVVGKLKNAETVLNSLKANNENQYCLEAKMLVAAASRNQVEAVNLALHALEKDSKVIFARYFLARNALKRKEPEQAFEHYEHLVEIYPDHNGIILDMAEVLTYLKKYSRAMEYARKAKPTLRRYLYITLIPLVLPKNRIILILGAFLLFALTGLNFYVWAGVSSILLIFTMVALLKDPLVFTRLIYLEIVFAITWLLCNWIWSLLA